MAKFTWQDGTLVSKAKVEIGGTIYEVDPEEYSGATPLSAGNLNAMQDGIYEDIEGIENDILGTTTPITWETNFSSITGTENSIHVNEAEKSCLLTFAVNRTSATEGSFTIGTFSTTYAPSNLVIGTGIVSTNGVVYACQLSINSNGNISINNAGHSSNTFRGQIKWYY